jgi:hypothetical protein
MLNKYITETMEHYLHKGDIAILQDMIDEAIFKDIDAYLHNEDITILQNIGKKVTEK